MRKIAITTPEFWQGEALAICSLLEKEGYWRVHIRKPDAIASQVENLLLQIPDRLWSKLSIHDHFELTEKFSIGGIHLNRRNPHAPKQWNGYTSRSLHSIEEIGMYDYDYAFLSPIFPSISKPDYNAIFDFDKLRETLNEKIYALGGVTPERFSEIESLGFGGAAMLGYVWKAKISPDKFKLQFITHPNPSMSMAEEVRLALEGGCRWIQLRHKNADIATIISEGLEIRDLCNEYDATFIIDDHVDLVNTVNADGVHLGKNDMPVMEARKLIGPMKIIGATANRFEDIQTANTQGADYVGVGPFRFTTTKQNLSPVLGLNGYREIIGACKDSNIDLPVVAIGGITIPDISDIMQTGVNGIAISGTIINAENPAKQTKEIITQLNTIQICPNS